MKNRTITICIGIPASGKSTWAKEQVKYKLDNTVRISRDDYRLMLKGAQQLDNKGENLVTELVNNAIIAAVNTKYDVILDATNVNKKYLEPTIEFCRKYADVKFRIFDISLDKAKERDAAREASVGDTVLRKMWSQYRSLIDSGFDLYSTREKYPRIEKNITWDRNDYREKAIIFDLDGTLAHNNNKRGYFDWNKVDVDDLDEIIEEVLYLLNNNSDYKILLVTGRDAEAEEKTVSWLKEHHVHYDALFMRPKGDYRKDTIIKTEIYNQHIKDNYNVLCVFDDRTKVVETWRELGLKCLQVINGDY